jgi:hypothetical protein
MRMKRAPGGAALAAALLLGACGDLDIQSTRTRRRSRR